MIVTLLTDFGLVDPYAGVMKGVILGDAPGVTVVDLTHGIAPGDVPAAAFALRASHPFFPAGTVHVAVVDPGVGTERRVLVVQASGQLFVGPDNGVFSYLLEGARVVHAVEDRFFRHPLSATFHGRDVFAPLAAALARGVPPLDLGPVIHDPVALPAIGARVLYIDRFGNCVTGVTGDVAGLRVRGVEVRTMRRYYAEGPPGVPFMIRGSAGFIELSMRGASAADALGARVGDEVEILS